MQSSYARDLDSDRDYYNLLQLLLPPDQPEPMRCGGDSRRRGSRSAPAIEKQLVNILFSRLMTMRLHLRMENQTAGPFPSGRDLGFCNSFHVKLRIMTP